MPQKKQLLYILCYNAVLDVKTENYSDLTFEIFIKYLESDYDIKLDINEFKTYFKKSALNTINEYDIIKKFFGIKNIMINEQQFDEMVYKLRVADRNEIRINRELKDVLLRIKEKFDLILVCSVIKQFAEKELKMFKLTDFFSKIIYLPPNFDINNNNDKNFSVIKNKKIITDFNQLSIL
ncbi:hypothetical protein KA977_07940 [Candidatus Dependentiae bacterium]|nr:hypothetical protein [Candidatus Dependentiae bacterium]